MKHTLQNTPILLAFIVLPFVVFGRSGPPGNGNISCSTAILMTDGVSEEYSGNFLFGSLVDEDEAPPCAAPNIQFPLRSYWYKFHADGIRNYFIDANNMLGSLEIFSGSCGALVSSGCVQSNQGTCYAQMYGFPEGMYYVRLSGYSIPGFFNYEMHLNSVDPTPPCTISIDDVSVYPCVNAEGKTPITVSGSLTDWEDFLGVYVEIETDESVFWTNEIETGDNWTANLEVQGTEITNVYASYGNAENPCVDVLNDITLPTEGCDTDQPASLTGVMDWNAHCRARPGEVWVYDPGTGILKAHYDVEIQGEGGFKIQYPILGTYDVIVKIEGFLPKGFTDVSIQNQANTLEVGSLTAGELTGDRFINVADVSTLNFWFNSSTPSSAPQIDLNCDDVINMTDVSHLNSVYGTVGESAPLGE